jgi:hypothetical protein
VLETDLVPPLRIRAAGRAPKLPVQLGPCLQSIDLGQRVQLEIGGRSRDSHGTRTKCILSLRASSAALDEGITTRWARRRTRWTRRRAPRPGQVPKMVAADHLTFYLVECCNAYRVFAVILWTCHVFFVEFHVIWWTASTHFLNPLCVLCGI